MADFFAALALDKMEATLYQIIGQLRHIITLFGAYVLFSESITLIKMVSILLIILGVAVAMGGQAKLKFSPAVVYALLSTLAIAFGFLFIKLATEEVPPALSGFFSLTIAGLLTYVVLFVRRERPVRLLPPEHRRALVVAAVIFAVFELALFNALNLGQASRVVPVFQSSVIFTFVGAYIFLHERDHLRQKIVGCGLIAVGVGLLYFV